MGFVSDLETEGEISPFWESLIAMWKPRKKDVIMGPF